MSDQDEEQDEGQGDSSAEDQQESETEEERDACLDKEEREKRSADVRTQDGYAFVDERRKRTDEATRGDDKRARIEEEVPEVLVTRKSELSGQRKHSASNRPRRTLSKTRLQRPQRLQKCHERKHRPWILETKKSSEAANSITLS